MWPGHAQGVQPRDRASSSGIELPSAETSGVGSSPTSVVGWSPTSGGGSSPTPEMFPGSEGAVCGR